MVSRAPSGRLEMHSVLSVNVSGQEHIYKLDRNRYEIGRSMRSTIRINHPEVSRLQAVLIRDPSGRFQIVDGDGVSISSSNGTYVNGVRIDKPYTLKSGDELRLGSSAVSARFFTSLPPQDELADIPELDGSDAGDSVTEMFLNNRL
ncbi:MAG: FHA domain-containing protein [Thermostichales cyanobacterium BF4_bins_65]